MEPRKELLFLRIMLGAGLVAAAAWPASARAGIRSVDPGQVVPMAQIAPEHRDAVGEVIRDHTLHRKGKPDTFPCNPRVYMSLLNEPVLTLGLWRDLADTPAQLQQIGANRYVGSDGSGTQASWEYVLRSPRLHVLLCHLDYSTPRGNARLNGRIVLIVRSGFYRETNGEYWVQHDIEAFVKIDSRGWKAAAATVRPLVEKILEDQVQEAGLFVSLMARMVEMYPDWARELAMRQASLSPESRDAFCQVVQQTRRPGAYTGRPVVMEDAKGVGESRLKRR